MARWHIRSGRWWMLQWAWPVPWCSLGVHVDPRRCSTESGQPFGPYIDIHVWVFCLSLGVNPVYTHGDTYRGTASRGGRAGCTDHDVYDPRFAPGFGVAALAFLGCFLGVVVAGLLT